MGRGGRGGGGDGRGGGGLGREAGVSAFRAIPYAAPPMGARRFQPPAPAAVWTDPRPATDVGPGCPQQMGEAYLGQEDCLTLDVWTPVTDPEEPLPVMVWLHGGGLVQGGGPDAMNDGRVLARDAEVVVVMVQYRLGALGYLGDPSLRDERGAVAGGRQRVHARHGAVRRLRDAEALAELEVVAGSSLSGTS